MHPKHLLIKDYTYNLPEEKIAKHPLTNRDSSKLLVYKQGEIEASTYQNLDEYLPSNSLLVFNNTKVVEARLLFKKPTGGVIEIFCLEPHEKYADITSAMLEKSKVWWKCLIGGASKWKHGTRLTKTISCHDNELIIEAAIINRQQENFVVEISWNNKKLTFAEILHLAGKIPLPPYLHREVEEEDKQRYQTIYAKHEGSVAAPTAGLHFTERVFEKLSAKNINKEYVTLHVGAGTFKPVKSEVLEEHEMHAEFIDVSYNTIENLLSNLDTTIVAVGTTSLRTIESLFWIGCKTFINPQVLPQQIDVEQWEPYEVKLQQLTAKDSLKNLLKWMQEKGLERIVCKTQIMIAPGYKLKIAKGIITNFHQPQSTLLLLIAAITGDDWKRIYEYALNNNFRFLSYGDGCLLWNNPTNES